MCLCGFWTCKEKKNVYVWLELFFFEMFIYHTNTCMYVCLHTSTIKIAKHMTLPRDIYWVYFFNVIFYYVVIIYYIDHQQNHVWVTYVWMTSHAIQTFFCSYIFLVQFIEFFSYYIALWLFFFLLSMCLL